MAREIIPSTAEWNHLLSTGNAWQDKATGRWYEGRPDQISNEIKQDPLLEKLIKGASEVPDYRGIADEKGNLLDAYKLMGQGDVDFQGILQDFESRQNRDALDLLKQRATATGNSPWANMMLQQNMLKQQGLLDDSARSSNAALAKARSAVASHGGLRSGVAERLAKSNMLGNMADQNSIRRQGKLDELGILTQEDDRKLGLLKDVQGMENQYTNAWADLANREAARRQELNLANRQYKTGVDQFNIGNAINDNANRGKFDLDRWKTQMEAWASDRTATAQEQAGKK